MFPKNIQFDFKTF